MRSGSQGMWKQTSCKNWNEYFPLLFNFRSRVTGVGGRAWEGAASNVGRVSRFSEQRQRTLGGVGRGVYGCVAVLCSKMSWFDKSINLSNSWSQLRRNLQHSARLQWTAVTPACENVRFSSLFAAGHATLSSLVDLLPLSNTRLGETNVFASYRGTRTGTLIQSDNGDAVEKNIWKKVDFSSFRTFWPLYQVTQLVKSRECTLEL